MRRGRFRSTQRLHAQVPTASMADIAFLLLIFFMATTIFRVEEGLDVTLPTAASAQTQAREKILHVWIDESGKILVNSQQVDAGEVEAIVKRALAAEPDLIVAFNADVRTPYRVIASVVAELQDARAVRVSFTSDQEPGVSPAQTP